MLMFDNIQNSLQGVFGKLAPGMCKLTVNGNVAVKCSGGKYKTYNVKTGKLTNVSNFCFNMGDDLFFLMPTTHVAKGDVVLINGKPKCVIDNNKDKTITVLDYEAGEIRQVVPERHVLMGSTYFYGKIVSIFGGAFKGGKGGLGNVMKMAMMQQLMGLGGNGNNGNGGFGQLAAMSMMMNGGGDFFGDMFNGAFDGMFDFDAAEITDGDDEGNDDANSKDAE